MADVPNRRESRGKSQNPSGVVGAANRGAHFSPISNAATTKGEAATEAKNDADEVAVDQVQRRSRRKVSHQLKQNESSDIEGNVTPGGRPGGTGDALENGLAAEATANN